MVRAGVALKSWLFNWLYHTLWLVAMLPTLPGGENKARWDWGLYIVFALYSFWISIVLPILTGENDRAHWSWTRQTTMSMLSTLGFEYSMRYFDKETAHNFNLALYGESWNSYFIRPFFYVALGSLFQQIRDRVYGSDAEVAPTPPGALIIEALIESQFTTERLILEVLNRKIFSRRYVQESIALAGSESLVVGLWVKAASEGHAEVLKQLVECEVPVNITLGVYPQKERRNSEWRGLTALILSAQNNRVHAVEALLKLGADPNVIGEQIPRQNDSPDRNRQTEKRSHGHREP